MEEAGRLTNTAPFTDVDAAKEVVANEFRVHSRDVRQVELPLTSNDYSGNVRPDGQFAKELDLGVLQNSVGYDSAIVKNFSSFSSDDKLIICKFIEKAQALYEYETEEYDELFILLRNRMRTIVLKFVHTAFHTEPSQTPKYRIMLMERFNTLALDELKQMVLDVLNKASIKELVENGDDINTKLASDFNRKVVAAMN